MLLWLPQEVDGSCSMNIKTPFVCLALDLGGVMILRCYVIMYSCLCVQEIVAECLCTAYTVNSLLTLTLYLPFYIPLHTPQVLVASFSVCRCMNSLKKILSVIFVHVT